MSDWQPIETAPKDGTRILLFWPHWGNEAFFGYFGRTNSYSEEWIGEHQLSIHNDPGPTHWMPLPAPPAKDNEND